MGRLTKICRVCGKEYEACYSAVRNDPVFRWQEVACSPECGKIYFQRIAESRMKTQREHCEESANVIETDSLINPTVSPVPNDVDTLQSDKISKKKVKHHKSHR